MIAVIISAIISAYISYLMSTFVISRYFSKLYSYGGTDGLLEIAQVKYPDRIMDPVGWLCERDAYERITR